METIGIILARGGSKRLPKKNIKMLKDKPMIYYTIHEALKSDLDHIIVSSDDENILAISRRIGADTIKRPPELARDDTPSYDALKHALFETESKMNKIYDTIVLLQPTSPFRRYTMINRSLRIDADAVVSVERCSFDKFVLNGAIFTLRREIFTQLKESSQYLIDDLIGLNLNIVALVTSRCIDIDTIDDFIEAEKMMIDEVD